MAYSDRKQAGRSRTTQWRGPTPGDEETPQSIDFRQDEYEQLPDKIRITVETIISKLPTPKRRKYGPLKWQQQLNLKEADLIRQGVGADWLAEWLRLNNAQTQRGRTPLANYNILVEVQQLMQTYGPDRLNRALAKVCAQAAPQKATVPYLRTVLRNQADKDLSASPAPEQPRKELATREDGERPGWPQVQAALQRRVSAPSYNTWLRQLRLIADAPDKLTLAAPSIVHQTWVIEHYVALIEQVAGRNVEVRVESV